MMRRLSPRLGVSVLALAITGACSCGGGRSRPAGILLITLDTVRADHLGCYGDAAAATPQLDAFAKEGVRFDQAMAAVPITLPSHATMFTGVNPPVHGVRYNGMFRLGEESVTIAELLKAAGFATGAVPAAFPVNAKSGLAQGFDTYRDLFSEPGADKLGATSERNATEVTRLGLETIRAAGKKPFFVWLHYYDAHYPYRPPFPYSSRFRDHPYDGEIAYVDAQLGELFAALRKDRLWDRIVVIVAGDHGEALYEHGERMHSVLTYQTTLRVPLIVKVPRGRKGAVVSEPVGLVDLAPTVLDLAGLAVPGGLAGISLRDALRGKAPPLRPIYFESLAAALSFGWSPIEGVRRGKWKLIRAGEPELYDLDADPREENDLHILEASKTADLVAVLDHELARWANAAAPAKQTEAPVDPQALARLASLGYVGGSVSSKRRNGPNPKTLIHLETELLLVQDMMMERRYREVLTSVANILRDDPGNRMALQNGAEASAALGEFAQGERYARDVMGRYPEFMPAVVTLGRIRAAQKDYRGAEQVFREGLGRFPDEPILVYSLALSLVASGHSEQAAPIVAKALEGKGADPAFLMLRALCRAIADDLPAAKKSLEAAIAGGYDNLASLRGDPLLAPLKKIPGFEAILAPKKGT